LAGVLDFYDNNKRLINMVLGVVLLLATLILLLPIIAEQKPSRMVQSTITGLLVGSVYSLIALGIVIINKASGVFNFAHGLMMLFGAMIFYTFFSSANVNPLAAGLMAFATVFIVLTMNGIADLRDTRRLMIGLVIGLFLTGFMSLPGRDLQFLRAIVGGLVGSVLVGLCVERFAIRPLIGQPLFASVLMTLAVSEFLLGITQMTWGSVELPLQLFAWMDGAGIPKNIIWEAETILGGAVRVRTDLLLVLILALLSFGAFVLFFRYTSVGLAMRATAENQQLAQSVGLRVRFILAVAWGIAALLATIGGVLQGGATSLSLNMPLLALRAFPAVLLGGLESIGGALVGGLVIGLVQEWANLLFPGTQAGTELAPYVVLMIVLVIRPDGLFGEKRIERI
jgi:branched-chain amino acid transport system permease protein